MAGRLAYSVVLTGPDGNPFTVTPDMDVPDWAAEQIGDHAYADSAEESGSDGPPPRAGRGSGKDAWAAYAATFDDVEVAEDATREDIIDAISEAGHPVE